MFKKISLLVFSFISLIMLASCAGKVTLSLPNESISLSVGETYNIQPVCSDEKASFSYSSSNEAIAKVSASGVVTALSIGNVTITVSLATNDAIKAELRVNVSGALALLPLEETSKTLAVGTEWSVTFTEAITGATYVSSDEAVATVSASGLVTALSLGTTTITVSASGYASAEITVTISAATLSIQGASTVTIGERETLVAYLNGETDTNVVWTSSDSSIATVNASGSVKGKKAGVVTITATDNELGLSQSHEMTVKEAMPESITIENTPDGEVHTTDLLYFMAKVSPSAANQEIIWDSSDETIATVEEGSIKIIKDGTVTITATSAIDAQVSTSCEIVIVYDPMQIIIDSFVSTPYHKIVTTYGASEKTAEVTGAAFLFTLADYATDWKTQNSTLEMIMPLSNPNRPGTKQTKTYFITVHDTANNTAGANAKRHAEFEYNNGNNKSWHYSVGADGVYHSLPDDEIAYNAEEDGRTEYALIDTSIKATSTAQPTFTINQNGYYELNGEQTTILAPLKSDGVRCTKDDLKDQIFSAEIGPNGNWYMGATWYSTYFGGCVSTYGGATNAIAMETCVDEGSDLYLTWQYAAKLVARLMTLHDIDLDHVVQHHFYSGKDCPMTMRHAGYWDTFKKMVWFEYLMETHLYAKGYTVTISSSNPSIISDTGRVVLIPTIATKVDVTVTLTAPDGKVTTKVFSPLVHY